MSLARLERSVLYGEVLQAADVIEGTTQLPRYQNIVPHHSKECARVPRMLNTWLIVIDNVYRLSDGLGDLIKNRKDILYSRLCTKVMLLKGTSINRHNTCYTRSLPSLSLSNLCRNFVAELPPKNLLILC